MFLVAPPRLPASWALGDPVLRTVGGVMVALALAYLAVCTTTRRRELGWRGHTLALPGAWLAWLQARTGCTVEVDAQAPLQAFPPINVQRLRGEWGVAPRAVLADDLLLNDASVVTDPVGVTPP